ncbi:Protein RTA1 [Ceratocystis lukuohia]|uniref:Protein RTA1 n=1 Tax=Ceratocystis lukuohia TaxID=2019550 RepID=A0ABR4MDB6_9PEZI
MGNSLLDPVPGVEPTKGGYYLWRYLPSQAAAALFLVLFTASFSYISWKTYKTRTYFCIVFAVGCLFEVIGYGSRISARSNTGSIMKYSIQNVFILVAPTIFAAAIYMTLGRIITSVRAEKYSMIRPSRLAKTFVIGDVLTFFIQGGGAGMMVSQSQNSVKLGEKIIIFGLVAQVVLFSLFGVVAAVFHRRLKRFPTADSLDGLIPWKETLVMLYSVSVLVMIRSIFRVIEYLQGHTGYSLSHEWTLYVFDTVPMFAVTVLFAWRFPSGLKRKGSISME